MQSLKSLIIFLLLLITASGCEHITAACLDCLRPGAGRVYLWCCEQAKRYDNNYNRMYNRYSEDQTPLELPPSREECQQQLNNWDNCPPCSMENVHSTDSNSDCKRQSQLKRLIERQTQQPLEDSKRCVMTEKEEQQCVKDVVEYCCKAYPDLEGCPGEASL